MPRTRLPFWDQTKSSVINPILLFEGRSTRIVDADEVSANPLGGKSILVAWLKSTNIQTSSGTRTVKTAKRLSSPPGLRDESATMTPARPTNGNIETSGYGNLLSGYAHGYKKAKRLFNSWKTMRHKRGVSQELFSQVPERAILYMPNTGKRTNYSGKQS